MTFTSDIPLSGESLGSTRDRIRANFQEVASVVAVNHVAFNAVGEGKHKFLQMPEQLAAPTTAVNEGGFYSKVGTNPAETNLFFRAENNGFEYQMTKSISSSTARFANNSVAYVANNNGGWVFLPGGLIMQYGRRTSPGTSGVVTFPLAFPSGNAPFSVSVSLERSSGNQTVSIDDGTPPTSTTFNYLTSSAGSTAVNWIAIGN